MSDTETDGDELALDTIFPVSTDLLSECISDGGHLISLLALSSFHVIKEPPRPPSPEPTFVTYVRERSDVSSSEQKRIIGDGLEEHWEKIELKLVGSHSLWGHYLYAMIIKFTCTALSTHSSL